MLFALQNAFASHAVERLSFLDASISKKHRLWKEEINQMFSTEDRMKRFLHELALFKGRDPLIPCVFWLYQKATLLAETPLFSEDGSVNRGRISSAQHVFSDVYKMTQKRYAPLHEEEQILWYLMRLERHEMLPEDEMYVLSDAAKKLPRRFSIGTLASPRSGSEPTPTTLKQALLEAQKKLAH